MCTVVRRYSQPHTVSSVALYDWLLTHFHPAPCIRRSDTCARRSLTTAALDNRPTSSFPSTRSVHVSLALSTRLTSYPSDDGTHTTSALPGRPAPSRSRRLPHVPSRPHLPPSELRALKEAAVRERRRRLAARHKELSFLSKAPLLASALPPSLANIAPALPRTDFSYAWPSLAFHRIPPKQQSQPQPAQQPAYESVRQSESYLRGLYERQLRERKADKNKAITALKQRINTTHNTASTAEQDNKQPYSECLEAVKHIRQLYSPLLTSHDYYTVILAAGLCMHERLLARLLEDAGIANVRLPPELFARLLQLLAPVDSTAAVRCVVVVAHEYFRQQHVRRSEVDERGGDGSRREWQRLPLSAEQYGSALRAVSRTSSTHLLLPLLHAFRQSSSRARENIPLVCTTVLPALRQLSHHQQHETLLLLSSAVLQWDVVLAAESQREMWSGPQLSDVCDLLELHFGSLSAEAALHESSQPPAASQFQQQKSASSFAQMDNQGASSFSPSSGRPWPMSIILPESWRAHLPPLSELCTAVPSLHQYSRYLSLSAGQSQTPHASTDTASPLSNERGDVERS